MKHKAESEHAKLSAIDRVRRNLPEGWTAAESISAFGNEAARIAVEPSRDDIRDAHRNKAVKQLKASVAERADLMKQDGWPVIGVDGFTIYLRP